MSKDLNSKISKDITQVENLNVSKEFRAVNSNFTIFPNLFNKNAIVKLKGIMNISDKLSASAIYTSTLNTNNLNATNLNAKELKLKGNNNILNDPIVDIRPSDNNSTSIKNTSLYIIAKDFGNSITSNGNIIINNQHAILGASTNNHLSLIKSHLITRTVFKEDPQTLSGEDLLNGLIRIQFNEAGKTVYLPENPEYILSQIVMGNLEMIQVTIYNQGEHAFFIKQNENNDRRISGNDITITRNSTKIIYLLKTMYTPLGNFMIFFS